MAVSPETLRLLAGLRVAMQRPVDAATERTVRAWATAWNELADQWRIAIEELVALSKDGQWPTRTQVARATKIRRAIEVTREALEALADELPLTITQHLPSVTQEAVAWERALLASQLPATDAGARIIAGFGRVDPAALDTIVRRTTEQVTSLSRPLSAQAEQAMRAALIRGVTVGDNPVAAAKVMLDRVEDGFNGGRSRALVIARTEILDAHREAGRVANMRDADVLSGWQWVCRLDRRSCPACWAMHGRVYSVATPGPWDHQQGRCARLPVARPWSELGLDVDEPASLLPDAQDVFDGLPREDQVAIMGAKRLGLIDAGRVGIGDLAQRRDTPGWRPSFVPRPVSDLAVAA